MYDYDGDGRAEVAMKTADGTVSGTGQVIGSASADYRNPSGYILSGPEYPAVEHAARPRRRHARRRPHPEPARARRVQGRREHVEPGSGVASNNGTKSTPALSGDLFGDWREEVVWRTSDSHALRVYSTPTPTDRRIYTLLHDIQYREAIAWQNTAYNQPPHPSFFIGNGMGTPPRPNIYLVG